MIVLNASALLALIKDEAGADVVARAAGTDDATISAVNYAETLQKAARAGVVVEDVDVARLPPPRGARRAVRRPG